MDITVALTVVAPSTTWWLVTTSPSEVSTMPVPAASAPSYFMVETMRTSPVSWESGGLAGGVRGAALAGAVSVASPPEPSYP